MAEWRYATPDVQEEFAHLPDSLAPTPPEDTLYTSISGTVLDQTGKEISVPRGKYVKVLHAGRGGKPWEFTIKNLQVSSLGKPMSLESGLIVVIFS